MIYFGLLIWFNIHNLILQRIWRNCLHSRRRNQSPPSIPHPPPHHPLPLLLPLFHHPPPQGQQMCWWDFTCIVVSCAGNPSFVLSFVVGAFVLLIALRFPFLLSLPLFLSFLFIYVLKRIICCCALEFRTNLPQFNSCYFIDCIINVVFFNCRNVNYCTWARTRNYATHKSLYHPLLPLLPLPLLHHVYPHLPLLLSLPMAITHPFLLTLVLLLLPLLLPHFTLTVIPLTLQPLLPLLPLLPTNKNS